MGIGVEEAQTRYKSIRRNFSKYVKRIKCTRSGAGRSDLPEIKEDYEHLRWLITHIKQRKSVSNFRQKNEEEVCRKEEEDVDSSGPNCGVTENGTDDEEVESGSSYDYNEGIGINYGSFKDMVADLTNKPEDEEISNILEEPSSTPGSKRSSSVILSRASTPDVELPKKKEKKLQNLTPAAPTLMNTRTTHKAKKRAWAKEKKPIAPIDVDAEFFQTMKAISHAIKDKDGPSQTKSSESEDLDEDKHFCLSLVGQLKNLERRYKSMVKIQILKIFNDVEWMKFSNSQPQIHQQHHTQFMAPMFNSEGSKEFQPYEQQSFMQHHGRKVMNHAAAANYTTLSNVRTSVNVENEL